MPDAPIIGFLILKKTYFVFGVIEFTVLFGDENTTFELVLYFSTLVDSHYRLRFEPARND